MDVIQTKLQSHCRRMTAGILSVVLAAATSWLHSQASARKSFESLPSAKLPQLFAEGVISTVNDEVGGAFSPDGKEFYFATVLLATNFPSLSVLCVSRWDSSHWGDPEVLPFSGKYFDYPPRLSQDGNTLYFSSLRPDADGKRRGMRIWSAKKTADGWSQPELMPVPINSADGRWNWTPSATADGTLYFASDRQSPGHPQIFYSRPLNGGYEIPQPLGPEVNAGYLEMDPYISPDGTLLIFASAGEGPPPTRQRPELRLAAGYPYTRGDLYFSVKSGGQWQKAIHLEHGVNTEAEESMPSLTPDGKLLFFSSERSPFVVPMRHAISMEEFERYAHSTLNGHGNIFYVELAALGVPHHE